MLCRICLCDKPAEAFYASNKSRCRECIKESSRAYRQANLDNYRQYDKLRASLPHRVAARVAYQQTPAGKEAVKRAHTKYHLTHAKRRAAQVAVGNAVRDGRLARQLCCVCGETAEAHHPDYDRPLDVVWLCQQHHKETHAIVANEPAIKEAA